MTLTAIAGTFVLAGTVKGIIGLGLPTMSLDLLTATLDLTTAMALLIVPSFATNLWQAAMGGHGRLILHRIWPFLLLATASVWIGALALTRLNLSLLSGLLGGLRVAYSTGSLAGVGLTIPAQREISAGPLFGTANGVLTGMTGSFVVPGVMSLQAIGLARDSLVQAMGMLFTTSTLALAAALQGNKPFNGVDRPGFRGRRDTRGLWHDCRATQTSQPFRDALPKGFLCRFSDARRLHHREISVASIVAEGSPRSRLRIMAPWPALFLQTPNRSTLRPRPLHPSRFQLP